MNKLGNYAIEFENKETKIFDIAIVVNVKTEDEAIQKFRESKFGSSTIILIRRMKKDHILNLKELK